MAPLPFYGWRAPPVRSRCNTSLIRAPGGWGEEGIHAAVVCGCADRERWFVPINEGSKMSYGLMCLWSGLQNNFS